MIILEGSPDSDYLALSIKGDEIQFVSHEMRIHEGSMATDWYKRPMITMSLSKLLRAIEMETRRRSTEDMIDGKTG